MGMPMKDSINLPVDATAKVIEIIAAQAMVEPSALTAQTCLADLALDSLAMVEIVFGLEEAFDITIPFNANAGQPSIDFSTPATIAAAIAHLT